jgi:hypothetical protein
MMRWAAGVAAFRSVAIQKEGGPTFWYPSGVM